jgi:hypothetical protein
LIYEKHDWILCQKLNIWNHETRVFAEGKNTLFTVDASFPIRIILAKWSYVTVPIYRGTLAINFKGFLNHTPKHFQVKLI